MTSAAFPCAILAGGLATRLHPLTVELPKALLDVHGEPFMYHQLRLLRRNGITRAVVCVGHLGELIRDAINDFRDATLHVDIQFDGPRLLGTAGALRAALPLLGKEFFVLYGDSYLPCDFQAVQAAFERSGKKALMTVFRNAGQLDRSNVRFEQGRILAYDKDQATAGMEHIDYGLGILSGAALETVPAGMPTDLATLYQGLLQRGELAAVEVKERFYEVGSFQGLQDMRELVASTMTSSRDVL